MSWEEKKELEREYDATLKLLDKGHAIDPEALWDLSARLREYGLAHWADQAAELCQKALENSAHFDGDAAH